MDTRSVSLHFGGLVLDAAAGALCRDGRRIELRPKTWALLQLLAREPGRVLSREELRQALWPGLVVVDDSLTQCVSELRRALGDQGRQIVRTVSRRGYRLDGLTGECAGDLAMAWELLRRIDGPSSIETARGIFEKAHEEDAQRPQALAGIALSHTIDVLNRWSRAPRWQVEVARHAADEALALDPALAIAHHARANVWMLQARHSEAEAGFHRALALDPGFGHSRVRLAIVAIEQGRPRRAALLLAGAAAQPASSREFLAQVAFARGMAQFHLGRDRAARACMDLALALRPGLPFARQWLAAIDALEGRVDSAAAHLDAFRGAVPGHTLQTLQVTERSANEDFLRQRRRFYEGLRRAGMPRC